MAGYYVLPSPELFGEAVIFAFSAYTVLLIVLGSLEEFGVWLYGRFVAHSGGR